MRLTGKVIVMTIDPVASMAKITAVCKSKEKRD